MQISKSPTYAMQISKSPTYYYWWSHQCNIAFPEMRFQININGNNIMTQGYSTNYYLEEIYWRDKIVVGVSDVNPLVIIKLNKDTEKINESLTSLNI